MARHLNPHQRLLTERPTALYDATRHGVATELAGFFHPDATADMVPFGYLGSGREVVEKLKVLRDGQPWMQPLHGAGGGDGPG